MRCLWGRGLRLELVAGMGIALALPALASPAVTGQGMATETSLSAVYHDQAGRTQAELTITVVGQDGQPATGAVVISDAGKPLAGVALNAEGQATTDLILAPGAHSLTATYAGDAAHSTSVSQVQPVRAAQGTTPGFGITIAPTTLSLKQGQSGSIVASITPVNASSLTAPMFVTLSCSGLPDQSSCSFTPENIEILPNASAAITSSMVIATVSSNAAQAIPSHTGSSPIAWAILLPGGFGLLGIAFGARRRAWLSRTALIAFVGLVTVLGTAGCNPLYNYKNHGPSPNQPTPAGTYTLKVTAQSSNGVTATTNSTTLALTVTQ